jgi:hypothetical protein
MYEMHPALFLKTECYSNLNGTLKIIDLFIIH